MSNDPKTILTDEIYSNPYNYTYAEVFQAIGGDADELYHNIYCSPNKNKYKTIAIKEVFKGLDTQKFVFELQDGYCIETVTIKRKTGTTVCVSTMVGCPVGCVFCASGRNGFIRNLSPSEIVQQVILVSGKVNRIVFMGMGEPLFNYDNVIKSIHILRDRKGLNFPTDGITISTIGPIMQLKKLREEHIKIQLTLSLHATNQQTRDYLMPHMKSNNIEEVVRAAISYSERHNRTVTIAYLLIPGLNDRKNDVKQLGKWFREKNVLINLLQYNVTDNKAIKRPNKQELVAFRDRLNEAGLTVKIRESRGNNIKAACGQLVSKRNQSQCSDKYPKIIDLQKDNGNKKQDRTKSDMTRPKKITRRKYGDKK